MRYIAVVLGLLLSCSAFAQKTDDNCDRLGGVWFGTYTLKDSSDCDKASGCTHGINVIVSQISGNNYHADARTMQGKLLSVFNLTCKDNIVQILNKGHASLGLQCTEKNICLAKYEDEKAMAMLLNLKM